VPDVPRMAALAVSNLFHQSHKHSLININVIAGGRRHSVPVTVALSADERLVKLILLTNRTCSYNPSDSYFRIAQFLEGVLEASLCKLE
jgi:hypothetical protein